MLCDSQCWSLSNCRVFFAENSYLKVRWMSYSCMWPTEQNLPFFTHLPNSFLLFLCYLGYKRSKLQKCQLLWWITMELHSIRQLKLLNSISICVIRIGWTNYRSFHNRPYLKTETSYIEWWDLTYCTYHYLSDWSKCTFVQISISVITNKFCFIKEITISPFIFTTLWINACNFHLFTLQT